MGIETQMITMSSLFICILHVLICIGMFAVSVTLAAHYADVILASTLIQSRDVDSTLLPYRLNATCPTKNLHSLLRLFFVYMR